MSYANRCHFLFALPKLLAWFRSKKLVGPFAGGKCDGMRAYGFEPDRGCR